MVGGAPVVAAEPPADEELRAAVAGREAAGDSRRDAIAAVATEYGLRKRDVYALGPHAIDSRLSQPSGQ